MSRLFLGEFFSTSQIGFYESETNTCEIKKSFFSNIDTSSTPDNSGAIHFSKGNSKVCVSESCFDQCTAYSMGASFFIMTAEASVTMSNIFRCRTVADLDSQSGIGGRLRNSKSNFTCSTVFQCSPHARYSGRSSFAIYYGLSRVNEVNVTNSRSSTNGLTLALPESGSSVSFSNVASQKGWHANRIENANNVEVRKCNFVDNIDITNEAVFYSGNGILNLVDCVFMNNFKDVLPIDSIKLQGCVTDKSFWNCENTINCRTNVNSSIGPFIRKYGCLVPGESAKKARMNLIFPKLLGLGFAINQ